MWSKPFFNTLQRSPGGLFLLFTFLLVSSCGDNTFSQPELNFTASGLCVTGLDVYEGIESFSVKKGESDWEEVEFSFTENMLTASYRWFPSEEYKVEIRGAIEGKQRSIFLEARAPLKPGLALVKTVDLQGHLGFAGPGEEVPEPTSAAMSEDGTWCAVGSNTGKVFLISLPSGRKAAEIGRTGAHIRSLAFAKNGDKQLVLVGEQSPRGSVSAYEITASVELKHQWTHEFSGEIGSSVQNIRDKYSWAHWPGIYRIVPVGEDCAIVLATHSPGAANMPPWSCLIKISLVDGQTLWRWPEEAPLSAVATWFDTDEGGEVAAVCAYSPESGLGTITLVQGTSGRLIEGKTIQPLKPLVTSVSFWRSVAVSPDGLRAALISNDGRAWLWNINENEFLALKLGEPIDAGGTPLLISGAGVAAEETYAMLITGTTYLPWSGSGEVRRPDPHPAARTALVYNWEGELFWSAPLPSLVQGMAKLRTKPWIIVGYANHPLYAPGGSSGIAVLNVLHAKEPLAATYSVEGGLMLGSPLSTPDGRMIVLVELVRRAGSGEHLSGRNELHILSW